MRERTELMGSELSIETSPAAGTVVRLTIDTGG
jgi:signal transduction histidine kinase